MGEVVTPLLHTPTVIRDCWLETSASGIYLIIRQVKFEADGSAIPKLMRLNESEQQILRTLIDEARRG